MGSNQKVFRLKILEYNFIKPPIKISLSLFPTTHSHSSSFSEHLEDPKITSGILETSSCQSTRMPTTKTEIRHFVSGQQQLTGRYSTSWCTYARNACWPDKDDIKTRNSETNSDRDDLEWIYSGYLAAKGKFLEF